MSVRVLTAELVRPQYWLATLSCGHSQEVHSVREGGPLYVKVCDQCPAPAFHVKFTKHEKIW